MTNKNKQINYFIVSLTEMLMKFHKASFDSALSAVLSSKTYYDIVNGDVLLGEGDLFVYELLEKELYNSGVLNPRQ